MSNRKKHVEYSECLTTSSENGLGKGKSIVLDLEKEHTEDIISKNFFPVKKEGEYAMLESLPTDRKRIWKSKLNTLENNIQITKSLKTLEAVLTLRGKGSSQFWTPLSAEISRKLWLPTEIDWHDSDSTSLNTSLPRTTGKSWFSTTTGVPHKKNSLKTSSQSLPCSHLECTDLGSTKIESNSKSKLKTLTLRALPLISQKSEINAASEAYKWYFNCTKDIFYKDGNEKKCTFGKNISNTKLRDIVRTYRYEEEKKGNLLFMDFVHSDEAPKFPDPCYWGKVHNRIPRAAVNSFVSNLNSARSNKRNGNISSYKLKYKTKKDATSTITFEDKGYPKWIDDIPAWYSYGRKRIPFKDLLKQITVKSITISLDKESGRYYIHLPVDVNWVPNHVEKQDTVTEHKKHPYISLDTGVRTFQMGYAGDHVVAIGDQGFKRLITLLLSTDSVQEEIDSCMRTRTRKRLKKRKLNTYRKIRNLVNDIHWKTCNFLVSNYHTIILPDFCISGMVKKSLNKMTKRLLYMFSYHKFKERLAYKADVFNSVLHIVDESYTSKTCCRCGVLNEKLGSSKVFSCSDCGLVIDRDINGAINILIKNWPTLQGH
jgi:putative transposase